MKNKAPREREGKTPKFNTLVSLEFHLPTTVHPCLITIGSVNWSTFTDLLRAIKNAEPNDLDDHSNPAEMIELPFPYRGCRYPYQRFHLAQNSDFSYMGRREFKRLSGDISRLIEFPWMTTHRELYLYGTLGYGKSYLLAAVVCFLIQRGMNVVYLPDCRALLRSLFYTSSMRFYSHSLINRLTNKYCSL